MLENVHYCIKCNVLLKKYHNISNFTNNRRYHSKIFLIAHNFLSAAVDYRRFSFLIQWIHTDILYFCVSDKLINLKRQSAKGIPFKVKLIKLVAGKFAVLHNMIFHNNNIIFRNENNMCIVFLKEKFIGFLVVGHLSMTLMKIFL